MGSTMASVFCEHKKLRTSCPACKAGAVPRPAPEATPYVSTDERLERQEKKAARAERAPATTSAPRADAAKAADDAARKRGPGNPLMPVRKKKQGVSAEEAASATAWW